MVGLSEMDSSSIVFAGRTGRGGKAARGCYGGEKGVGGGRAAAVLRRCRGGRIESGGRRVEQGGWWRWREKDLRFFEKFSYER